MLLKLDCVAVLWQALEEEDERLDAKELERQLAETRRELSKAMKQALEAEKSKESAVSAS